MGRFEKKLEVMSESCKISEDQQNRIKMKCSSSSINLSHLPIVGKTPVYSRDTTEERFESRILLKANAMRHQTECRDEIEPET